MVVPNSKPDNLADLVFNKLKPEVTGGIKPNKTVLRSLMEIMFYASLKTEEGQLLNVTVTLIDHELSYPLKKKSSDAWNFVKLENRQPFQVKTLVKLAKAADPWSGSIAVYYDSDEQLWINGMIDQTVHNQSYLNYETDRRPLQPGILQVSIIGIGALSVFSGYEEIGTLKQDNLIKGYVDVLDRGPVSASLKSRTTKLKTELTKYVRSIDAEKSIKLDTMVKTCVKMVFSRILIQIQKYHHGGSILFTSGSRNLDIKYKISYDRLHRAMLNYLKNKIDERVYNFELLDEPNMEPQTIEQYKRQVEIHSQKIKANNELKGTIRFIASQSCVDGLVLIDDHLCIKGFGTVIKKIMLPDRVWQCSNVYANEDDFEDSDPENPGTRHRSIFSHCWNTPGSLGFVVSQDGDVRAILRIGDKLIMWENIKAKQTRDSQNVDHGTINSERKSRSV